MEKITPAQLDTLLDNLSTLSKGMKDMKEYQETFQSFFKGNAHLYEKLTNILENQVGIEADIRLYKDKGQVKSNSSLESLLKFIEEYNEKFESIQNNLVNVAENFEKNISEYFEHRKKTLEKYFTDKDTEFDNFVESQKGIYSKLIEDSKKIIDPKNLITPLNNLASLPSIDELLKKMVLQIETTGKQKQNEAIEVMGKLGASIDRLCDLYENKSVNSSKADTDTVHKTEESVTRQTNELYALYNDNTELLDIVQQRDHPNSLFLLKIDIDITNRKKATYSLAYPLTQYAEGITVVKEKLEKFTLILRNDSLIENYRCPDCQKIYTKEEFKRVGGGCKVGGHTKKLLEPFAMNTKMVSFGQANEITATTWRISKKTELNIF